MKDSFIFEGKKYISARRASEISDYASDYVGQLCRAGKLDCRMIGRSWFVTEESIHLHKAAISREEASRSRIENLKGKATKSSAPTSGDNFSVKISTETTLSNVSTPAVSEVLEQVSVKPVAPVHSIVSTPVSLSQSVVPALLVAPASALTPTPWTIETPIKSPFIYSSDDRPLLPVLKGKTSIEKNNIKSPIVVSESSQKIFINKKDSAKQTEVFSTSSSTTSSTKTVSASAPTSAVATVSVPALISTTPSQSKVAPKASKESKLNKNYRLKSLVSYPELTREIILKRVIAPVFAFVILFGLGTGTHIIAEKVGNSSTAVKFAGSMQASSANVSDAFAKAYSGIKSGYKSVVAFFTSPSQLAVSVPEEFGDVVVSEVTPNGIVLAPSAGSETVDDAMKQKIRASFSDDVNISADGSGTAGVITPVFKDTNGKDFIYVMVPVKDAKDSQVK